MTKNCAERRIEAEDFYHEFTQERCECGTLEDRGTFPNKCLPCTAKIARFTYEKALERAIAELEGLAKERCNMCANGEPVLRSQMTVKFVHAKYGNSCACLAQPEQRRLAALRDEWDQLVNSGHSPQVPAKHPEHIKQP